jgi:hypothetical protein
MLRLLSPPLLLAFSVSAAGQQLIDDFDSGSPGAAQEHFGSACASLPDIDGDGIDDLLIAAKFARTDRGEVYVISGASRTVIESRHGRSTGDRFGTSIDALGDVDGDGIADFIVGVPFRDGAWTWLGAAYVYSGASASLIRAHVGEGIGADEFGDGVGCLGDVNADGIDDYAVGAIFHDYSSTVVQSGRLYVYSGASGGLLYKLDGTTNYEELGYRVRRAGDIDGDGVADFLVTSLQSSNLSSGFGRVDVISGATGTVLQSFFGAGPWWGSFGHSIAGSQDISGDSIPDILIGDMYCDQSGSLAGAAYAYSGADGSLLFQWFGESPDDRFGIDISFAGDVNGDQVSDVLVGSSHFKRAGHAYLYSGATGRLLYRFSSSLDGDGFGEALTGTRDIDGDGSRDVLVTAMDDQQLDHNAGRAYLFAGNDLFLQASAHDLFAGDTPTLSVRAREPGAFAATFITQVNTSPALILLDAGFTDPFGERALTGAVPAGLSGLSIEVRAYATDSRSCVVDSAPEVLSFQ